MLHLGSLKNQVFFRKNQFFLFKKINLWTFRVFLLFRRIPRHFCYFYHFLKYFFSENPSFIMEKKWTLWENVIFPMHSTTNLLNSAIFKKLKFLCKTELFFSKIGPLNALGVFTVSFFGTFATFTKISNLEKISKNPFLFHKKPMIWTCLEVLQFRSHSTVICYIYQFLKNWKKLQKPISVTKKNPKLERLEKSYFFRTHSTSNFFPLAIYKNFMFYFWKIHVFFSRKANFARFEKLYHFSRILRENCNIQHI